MRDESFAIMDVAEEAGIDFIDVADVYPVGGTLETVGRTEEIVGEWMAGKRERFVVATKVYGRPDRPQRRRQLAPPRHRRVREVAAAVRTDFIDLYYIHRWDPETPVDETLAAFDDLRRAGKIRYAGCSNIAAWQMMSALWTADREHTVRFDAVQPRYNILFRQIERELLPAAQANGVGAVVFNPLAAGMLTGKYKRGQTAREGTRFTLGTRRRTLPAALLAGRAARGRRAARAGRRVAWQVHHSRRVALGARSAGRHGRDRRREPGRAAARFAAGDRRRVRRRRPPRVRRRLVRAPAPPAGGRTLNRRRPIETCSHTRAAVQKRRGPGDESLGPRTFAR